MRVVPYYSQYLLFQCTPKSFSHNVSPTTEIYTLSLHDALPISDDLAGLTVGRDHAARIAGDRDDEIAPERDAARSEEHTSELQSRPHLVCRLLLEKQN